MDPTATLNSMLGSLASGDVEDAIELSHDLRGWVRNGGALPTGRWTADEVDAVLRFMTLVEVRKRQDDVDAADLAVDEAGD